MIDTSPRANSPMEVGRSSSQSALSERPGRWNGRVERGAESARKRDCSHEDCPPTLVGLRGGRLSLTANLSYEPPSPDADMRGSGRSMTYLVSRHAKHVRPFGVPPCRRVPLGSFQYARRATVPR